MGEMSSGENNKIIIQICYLFHLRRTLPSSRYRSLAHASSGWRRPSAALHSYCPAYCGVVGCVCLHLLQDVWGGRRRAHLAFCGFHKEGQSVSQSGGGFTARAREEARAAFD